MKPKHFRVRVPKHTPNRRQLKKTAKVVECLVNQPEIVTAIRAEVAREMMRQHGLCPDCGLLAHDHIVTTAVCTCGEWLSPAKGCFCIAKQLACQNADNFKVVYGQRLQTAPDSEKKTS